MLRTEIPLSKSKVLLLLLLLLISIAFIAAGYWMFNLDASEIQSRLRYNPLFVHGVGLASIAMGSLGGLIAIRKFIDSSPGLVLDERGLTDNSSAFPAGFIPWSDIRGFEVRQILNQRILYVLLNDPEKYVAEFKPFKRAILSANKKLAVSPAAIISNSLSIGFDELVSLTNQHLSAQRQGG